MRMYLTCLLSPHYRVTAVTNGAASARTPAMCMRQPNLLLVDAHDAGDGWLCPAACGAQRSTGVCTALDLAFRTRRGRVACGRIAGPRAMITSSNPSLCCELLARIEAHLALQRLRHEALSAYQQSAETLTRA